MPINIDLSKTQRYIEWLKTKLYLDSIARNARRRTVKRGEVYWCNLGMGIGSEECKKRPCVVLQYDAGNISSPNTIVSPITHSSSTLPVIVPIGDKYDTGGNLILDGNVLLGNIVCISKARLEDFITRLEPDEMKAVDEAIAISLDVKRYYDKLKNIHLDKLEYIEKLRAKIDKMKEEILNKDKDLEAINNLKEELNFESIEELHKFIKGKNYQRSIDK